METVLSSKRSRTAKILPDAIHEIILHVSRMRKHGPAKCNNKYEQVCSALNAREEHVKMAVKTVFWNVSQCHLVEAYRSFRDDYRLIALMMEADKELSNVGQFLPNYMAQHPEDSHLHNRRHQNLKSHPNTALIASVQPKLNSTSSFLNSNYVYEAVKIHRSPILKYVP
jgi:hypothetical protein